MRSPLWLLAIGACAGLLTLGLSLLLPHDRYIRWQAMHVEAFARLGWVYERIHFDPTPIDIAFLGTSHTMNGIDPQAVERAIAEAGGSCRHVTNIAIPAYGRNLHWLLARELLANRQVGTLVLEVFENETRRPHQAFVHVADVADVLGAKLLINLNFFGDIARLPLRQATLAIKTLLPEQFGLHRGFDPARYDGPNPDSTRQVIVNGVAITPLRDRVMDPALLEREAARTRAAKELHMLPERFDAIEYGLPRYYLDRILALARERGTRVVFLYLPSYGQPELPHDMRLYEGRADMLRANDILAERSFWYDLHHLNLTGAAVLSARMGRLLATSTPRDATQPATSSAPCEPLAARVSPRPL